VAPAHITRFRLLAKCVTAGEFGRLRVGGVHGPSGRAPRAAVGDEDRLQLAS
jgi:hypothetical protein